MTGSLPPSCNSCSACSLLSAHLPRLDISSFSAFQPPVLNRSRFSFLCLICPQEEEALLCGEVGASINTSADFAGHMDRPSCTEWLPSCVPCLIHMVAVRDFTQTHYIWLYYFFAYFSRTVGSSWVLGMIHSKHLCGEQCIDLRDLEAYWVAVARTSWCCVLWTAPRTRLG